MTRRRIRRIADPMHRKLLRAWHFCPRGGSKEVRRKRLAEFVRSELARSLRSPKAETQEARQ